MTKFVSNKSKSAEIASSQAAPRNDVIKVENLTKQFMGLKAIDDLSIEIPYGMTTGLIGPNGSGKTTLMNVLTGLLTPEAGKLQIETHNYRKVKPTKLRELKMARTFQDGRLIEQMSVEDNLLLAVAENGYWKSFTELNTNKYQKRLEEVLQITNLVEHRHKRAEELSYGLRKLLEMGRSLIQDAEIYFFDEPFTGLFPEVVEQVCEILGDLKKQGKTLVIIEHNMGLIERLCDYTIVLDSGRLLAEGKPAQVLKDKKVQEAYLGK